MLRSAQSSPRSVQISSSVSKPKLAPKPRVTWKLENSPSTELSLHSITPSNFDDEIDRLFKEFDEKCEKFWKEDMDKFPTLQKAPCASTSAPRFRQTKKISLCKPPEKKTTGTTHTNRSQSVQIKDPIQLDITLKEEKKVTSDKFEVIVDVTGFEISELSVRTEGERLLIHAKTKKITGNPGRVSRELKRDYQLPTTVDPYDVTAKLMTYGQLCIEAPIKAQ